MKSLIVENFAIHVTIGLALLRKVFNQTGFNRKFNPN